MCIYTTLGVKASRNHEVHYMTIQHTTLQYNLLKLFHAHRHTINSTYITNCNT